MAIQFACPYCTADIRVPDSTMGQPIVCPKCGTQVQVPRVEIPPATEPDPPTSDVDYLDLPTTIVLEQTPIPKPVATPATTTDIPVPGTVPIELGADQPRMATRLKRRRKRTRWWIPVTFGGIFLACLFAVYWVYGPHLRGNLTASVVSVRDLPPRLIDKTTLELSDDVSDPVLERLAQLPEVLKSQYLVTRFKGTPRGLLVQLDRGPKSECFSVDIGQDARLQEYNARHAREFDEDRRRVLTAATRRLLQMVHKSSKDEEPLRNIADYRDSVGLNALVHGLGFQVEAIASGRAFRCVYEADGRLYFLLPTGTRQFELQGRTLDDGTVAFPGHYTVDVTNARR